MGVAVVIIDDGRPAYLREAIASIDKHFPWMPSDHRILVNDSGDAQYAQILLHDYPHIDRQVHHAHRRGLAGALQSAWSAALDFDCEFVFHAEGDFTYDTDIPIGEMADLLDNEPLLAQVSLKRHPVNAHEEACGGTIETAPDLYHQERGYVSHRALFTFNPCLIRRHIIELCLRNPGDGLERGLTDMLLAEGCHFGIYGQLADPPRVRHIGVSRAAGWAL